MFALFASERNWLALSRPDLPITSPVVGTVAWPAFLALAPAADCAIVAVPPGRTDALYAGLRALRARHPFVPLVLVTEQALPHDIGLLGEVVRPPLELRRLWPAIQRATTRSLLAEAAARMERADARPAVLRTAAAHACRADPPIRSVASLAALVGCHRRTLWRHWQATGALAAVCSMDDLLDWVLMLQACALYRGPSRWGAVATRVGVHRQTLARIASSLGQVPLREVTPDLAPRLRAAFRRAVLDPFAPAHVDSGPQPLGDDVRGCAGGRDPTADATRPT